jgi:hypothetical protein
MTAKEELRRLVGELSDEQAQQVVEYLRGLLCRAETREAIDEMIWEGSPVPLGAPTEPADEPRWQPLTTAA